MEPKGAFRNQKWGIFKNQFLFHELKLFYRSIWYPKNHPPSMKSTTSYENFPFFGQTPYKCDLINPVTNKFYSGILIRVANETGRESLTDQ